jgi:hypothetical protein
LGRKSGVPSKRWAEEEKALLVENYGKMLPLEVSQLLPNRSIGTIKVMAHKLGLSTRRPLCGRRYSQCDHTLLVDEVYGLRELGNRWEDINRLYGQDMRNLVRKQGWYCTDEKRKRWDSQDIDYLISNAGSKTNRELAADLGRKIGGIKAKKQELGLVTKREHGTNSYSDADIQFIRDNLDMTDKELARCLHRSWKSILNKRSSLGIRKVVR